MSYNYASFQLALALEMAIPNNNVNDANFQAILPTIIDYAERRCYRELDLVYATSAQTVTLTANNRNVNLLNLVPYLYILEELNVITPAGQSPDAGSRNQLSVVSKEWLDAVWTSSSGAAVPRYFALVTDVNLILGPWPDQGYTLEVVGKYLPLQLYDPFGQSGTFLSLYLPDLFLAAAMISASGYRKNYGAQADEPRMAMSWEQVFQTLLQSAKSEETRRRFQAYQQLSSKSTPIAA